MKNYLLLAIPFMFLLSSCKHENLKTGNTKEKLQIVKKLCFIKNTYSKEKNYATIDLIDHIKISELDSTVTYEQIIELPDNYCYANKEKKYENYEISDSVKIIMQTFSYDAEGNYNFRQSIILTDLINEIENSKRTIFLNSPYEIEIVNNKVVSLKEIYIP